ncbi:hypothetical protein [Candidatus Nitrotoga arctica]|uniref:FtsH Extracellular n=1 Tax=Candidatus Nitrotoga arctica TaxID=453162 RepID=A0ABM8Z337_9PROT|nr:hypothetical protein [Candidatus Nitrotoga arctica]CAG9934334.1 conserved protein of unknown function [Candidatus Nitrotoga arctica]
MTWVFNAPLVSLSVDNTVERSKALWEAEDLGGMTEDNNRLPVPVVILVMLTVVTAFLTTFPLWGQRPTAAIYADFIKVMDNPEIQSIQEAQGDDAAMKRIIEINKDSPLKGQQDRHPVTMSDLRVLKPQIEEIMKIPDVDLKDYTVVGPEVKIANFEGNYRANGKRERQQPWWDKGYLIDLFYLTMFFVGVTVTVKRLPPYTWQPRHHDHDQRHGDRRHNV